MKNNKKIFIPPQLNEAELSILELKYYRPIFTEMKLELRSLGVHIPKEMPDYLPAHYKDIKL